MGGSSGLEGRVEVCMGGVWGTVCDDFWGTDDAAVVCASLGYSRASMLIYSAAGIVLCDCIILDAIAQSFAFFGRGTGPIYLDNVQCNGDEASIQFCTHLTTHNCVHSEDAGVTCIGTLILSF